MAAWARLVWNRGDGDYEDEDKHEHHHRYPPAWRQRPGREPPHLWPPRLRNGHGEHLPFAFRVMLLDQDKGLIYGRPETVAQTQLHPIEHHGTTVGYLGVLPGPTLSQLGEVRFLQRQRHAFIIIGLVMLVFLLLTEYKIKVVRK